MKNLSKREKKHLKIRKRIIGTENRPRLAVFKSNQHIYAQIIDDNTGRTLAAESDLKIGKKGPKRELAFEVGKSLAKKATAKGIGSVVFDRGGFPYQGRITKLAEGAREGGLKF